MTTILHMFDSPILVVLINSVLFVANQQKLRTIGINIDCLFLSDNQNFKILFLPHLFGELFWMFFKLKKRRKKTTRVKRE